MAFRIFYGHFRADKGLAENMIRIFFFLEVRIHRKSDAICRRRIVKKLFVYKTYFDFRDKVNDDFIGGDF